LPVSILLRSLPSLIILTLFIPLFNVKLKVKFLHLKGELIDK